MKTCLLFILVSHIWTMISIEKYLLCQNSQEYTHMCTRMCTRLLINFPQTFSIDLPGYIVYGYFIEHAVCSIIAINIRTWALDEQQHPAEGYFLDE